VGPHRQLRRDGEEIGQDLGQVFDVELGAPQPQQPRKALDIGAPASSVEELPQGLELDVEAGDAIVCLTSRFQVMGDNRPRLPTPSGRLRFVADPSASAPETAS